MWAVSSRLQLHTVLISFQHIYLILLQEDSSYEAHK